MSKEGSTDPSFAFNHLASPYLEDPYGLFEELRRKGPVVFNPTFGMWFVTRHDEVVAALRDPRRFSSADVLRAPSNLPPEALAILREDYSGVYPLLASDPPAHTRVRELVAKAFTPSQIAAFEPRVRAIATELALAFVNAGEAEIMSQFTAPLPLRIMGAMFGMTDADLVDLKRWCDDEARFTFAPLERDELVACARSVAAFRRYLRKLVEDHRADPRDDLVTALVDARLAGEVPLSTDEIVGLLCVLIFAGHETTTNMIANAVLHLLRRKGEWERLRETPSLIPAAFEEAMRFDTSVQGIPRTVTEDVELGGVKLPKGAKVFLLYASANRDEAQVPHADRFDPARPDAAQHVAFGRGIHFCIGAALARLEGRVALEVLTQHLPNARLASSEPLTYLPNLVHRGPRLLKLAWDV